MPSVWRNPTPAMRAGSAISRCSYDKIGDVQKASRRPCGRAEILFRQPRHKRAAGEIRSRQCGLAARSLGVAMTRSATCRSTQGDLAGALKSYSDSLAIRDRLAKSDPGNAGWQRDLSVSYNKVGDVQVAQGDLPEALKSFPRQPRHCRAPRQIRPRQCGLAARSLDQLRSSWRRAAWIKAIFQARSNPIPTSLAIRDRSYSRSGSRQCEFATRYSRDLCQSRAGAQAIRRRGKSARLFAARPGDHGALDKTLAGQCRVGK